MADSQPQQQATTTSADCQCKNIYHYRNNATCKNPARWCQWCKDAGCTLQRRRDARRDSRGTQAVREGGGGGGGGLPMMGFRFPVFPGPFGPYMQNTSGDDTDDDSGSSDW
ncbi:hypothetical protein VPNG_08706 [Cytospora leucostoma]|uniref:Uncharacterized protein n=1 Tax=Cytospora leucostoma TaxID=1230097 RepID=A0A423W2E9_9PEZI|nr:hypothetical protein VPNG_08706 [Cytospora leucostoma]